MNEDLHTASALRARIAFLENELHSLQIQNTEEVLQLQEESLHWRRTAQSYQAMLENTHDVIYILDRNGIFTYVSTSWQKALGHAPDQVLGKHFSSFVHQDDVAKCEKFIADVFNSIDGIGGIEYHVLSSDGKWRCHNSNAMPVLNEHKVVVAMQGIARDVTETKHAQLVVQYSEERFNTLLQSLSFLPVQGYSADCIIRYWNKASESLYGYTSEEAVGKNLLDLIATPYSREVILEAIEKMLQTGKAVASTELPLITKDGKLLVVYSTHAFINKPGGEAEFFCLDIDMTERNRAEKALQESTSRLVRAEKASKSGNWELHLAERLMYASDGAVRLYGLDANVVPFELAQKVPLPEYRPLLDAALSNLINKGIPYSVEFKIKQIGTGTIIDIYSVAEYDAEKRILFGVIQDITERKLAEQALKDSEEKFKAIANYSASWEAWFSNNGKMLWMSSFSLPLTGYTPDEFLANDNLLNSIILPEDLDLTNRAFAEAFQGSSGDNLEFRVRKRDGSIFWALGCWRPIKDAAGNSMGFRTSVQDITIKKQMETALRESEEKYRSLIQYSSDPIFSFNPDLTYRFVNESFARFFNKTQEELIGNSMEVLFYGDELEKRVQALQHVFHTGEKANLEVDFPDIGEGGKYLVTVIDPIKDADGNVQWVTCISKDITERKKAELALLQKNRELENLNSEKDKLFRIIGHDLKSPFHGLIGLSGLMVNQLDQISKEEITDYTRELNQSIVNVYKLIENLLDWAQLRKSSESFSPRRTNLLEIYQKSVTAVEQNAIQKQITISSAINNDLFVHADEKMINAVFRNLLSNAVKFSFRNNRILVVAEPLVNNRIQVAVSDNGVGMSEHISGSLFVSGSNIRTKGTEGEPSTGLGMLLCKEFVEKHGGSISVESNEGIGSTFRFTLPIAE